MSAITGFSSSSADNQGFKPAKDTEIILEKFLRLP
jgi:hypothetical protein